MSNEVGNFATIDSTELLKLKELPADVYLKVADKFIKLFNKGDQVEVERISKYRSKGKTSDLFFVDENFHHLFQGIKYLPVRVRTLTPDRPLPFPTYMEKDGEIVTFLKLNEVYTKDHAQIFLSRKVKQIYVKEVDETLYQAYIDENLEKVVASDAAASDKANALFVASKKILEEVYAHFDPKGMLKIARLSKNINKFIKENKLDGLAEIMKDAGRGKLHDLAFKSATLCLTMIDFIHNNPENPDAKVVAQHIDNGDLSREIVVMSALLQDIGVKNNHQAEMNQHSTVGAYMIDTSSDSILHKKVAQVVAQHEEFCDGTGRPAGLTKTQLSPYTQILSVAQSYNRVRHQYNLSNAGTIKGLKASGAKFNKYLINIIEKIVTA